MQDDIADAHAEQAESATPTPGRVRRFSAQRGLLNNIIKANGPEWDQPRLASLVAAIGPEAANDTAAVRQRVPKLAHMSPAFAWAARLRQQKAELAAAEGHRLTARDNYFMAANYWASAQWSVDQNDAHN